MAVNEVQAGSSAASGAAAGLVAGPIGAIIGGAAGYAAGGGLGDLFGKPKPPPPPPKPWYEKGETWAIAGGVAFLLILSALVYKKRHGK